MAINQSLNTIIPVIDISGYLAGDLPRTAEIANELNAACCAPGFFQIVGHDIPPELRTRLFDKVTQFYDLPITKKSALSRSLSVNGARGYEAVGAVTLEGDFVDQKEGFMIGLKIRPEGSSKVRTYGQKKGIVQDFAPRWRSISPLCEASA